MPNLNSIEEIEQVALQLRNKNSKPEQYLIKYFGYCTSCKKVTEVETTFSKVQLLLITCKNCHRTSNWGEKRYLTGNLIPKKFRKEAAMLNSIAKQREYFNEIVGDLIRQRKQMVTDIGKEVQQLIALQF